MALLACVAMVTETRAVLRLELKPEATAQVEAPPLNKGDLAGVRYSLYRIARGGDGKRLMGTGPVPCCISLLDVHSNHSAVPYHCLFISCREQAIPPLWHYRPHWFTLHTHLYCRIVVSRPNCLVAYLLVKPTG